MSIDWNGHPPLPRRRIRLRRRVAYLLKRHPNAYITATTDGVHAPGSYHYSARAVDFGSDNANNGPEKKVQQTAVKKWGNRWAEVFGPLGFYVKDGRRYAGHFPDHGDHTHVAL